MPLSRTSSSSSTEVAGFVVERQLGRGSRARVFEATQLSLQRRVALKLLDGAPVDGELCWPEHPRVVSLYAAGPCEQGYFVAMQLVRGTSLAEAPRRALLPLLEDVAAGLDAAHRAGIAHGAVNARNVLVGEGRAFLSDFGLGEGEATQAVDLADFATLVGELLELPPPDGPPASAAAIVAEARRRVGPGRRSRWPLGAHARPQGAPARRSLALWALAATLVAGVATLVVAMSRGSSDQVPAPLDGAVTLGSSLPSSGARSVDCDDGSPSGSSEPCLVVQTRLDGRPVVARSDGVIRRWALRDARGDLALEVLRRRGAGTYVVARTSARVPGARVRVLPANLPVRAGDLVGLAVAPGTAVGVRHAAGATTARRLGPADLPPGEFDSKARGEELLLRVEYLPGQTWRPAGLLTGRRAALAPEGRTLDSLELHPGVSVAAVSAGGRVAADLEVDGRRIQRLFVAGAGPAGRLGSLYTLRVRFGRPILRLLWRNPSGVVSRDFSAGRRGLVPID